MNIEKQKLADMLDEKKITKEDYQLLVHALDKQESKRSLVALFINPFQKIAGQTALLAGLVIIVVMSYMGVVADVYYAGIFDCLNAANLKHTQAIKPNFSLLLTQNVINWLSLSATFILSAIIFKQKRFRVIDFLGTVAFSRFPTLILTTFIAIVWAANPSLLDFDVTKTTFQYHFNISGTLIDFMWQFCYAWQITIYLFALKESSGLNGTKLWIAFVVSVFTADQFSHLLGTYLMWP